MKRFVKMDEPLAMRLTISRTHTQETVRNQMKLKKKKQKMRHETQKPRRTNEWWWWWRWQTVSAVSEEDTQNTHTLTLCHECVFCCEPVPAPDTSFVIWCPYRHQAYTRSRSHTDHPVRFAFFRNKIPKQVYFRIVSGSILFAVWFLLFFFVVVWLCGCEFSCVLRLSLDDFSWRSTFLCIPFQPMPFVIYIYEFGWRCAQSRRPEVSHCRYLRCVGIVRSLCQIVMMIAIQFDRCEASFYIYFLSSHIVNIDRFSMAEMLRV